MNQSRQTTERIRQQQVFVGLLPSWFSLLFVVSLVAMFPVSLALVHSSSVKPSFMVLPSQIRSPPTRLPSSSAVPTCELHGRRKTGLASATTAILPGMNGGSNELTFTNGSVRPVSSEEQLRVGVLLLNLGGPERTEDVEGTSRQSFSCSFLAHERSYSSRLSTSIQLST